MAAVRRDVAGAGAEERLAFVNTVLRAQMDASPSAIIVIDNDRRIIFHNDRFETMWGLLETDLTGQDALAVLEPVLSQVEERDRVVAGFHRAEPDPDNGNRFDSEIRTRDGRSIERYTVTLRDPSGGVLGRAWFFTDVTEHKRALAHAAHVARVDSLTGLLNRVVFVETLDRAIAENRKGGGAFAVLYIGVDNFKDVNDTVGHAVGDELLQAFAKRLQSHTREGDILARFGSDEFAVLLDGISDPKDVEAVAAKLIGVLEAPFSIRGARIHSGASIGVALLRDKPAHGEGMLSHADLALHCAKAEGRGGYKVFQPTMDSQARMRVTLAAELREAIANDQLFLMYQPQIAMADGAITGVEALVRWRHPVHGVVGPNVFIPIAERMGLIGALGRWVLAAAARQCKAWLDSGAKPVRMAVNLSSLQFKKSVGLEADIAAVLAETGLPPELLELELTETVLMDLSREHGDMLLRLRDAGMTFAIDDFGTGYSSLDYLRRFPADRIKIAQTFVEDLTTAPVNAAIVKATIGLAREIGISSIAEGVETAEQAEILRRMGCDECQGFYFARPLSAEAVAALLVQGGRLGAPPTPRLRRANAL